MSESMSDVLSPEGGVKRGRSTSPAPSDAGQGVISPPPSSEFKSPPYSRRRLLSPVSSPGHGLISSPHTNLPTSEIDVSSPLNFGTPSSRLGGTPGEWIQGTPRRQRSDIGGSHRVREVNLDSMTGDHTSTGVTSEGAAEAHLIIWGTNINTKDTKKKFREFLERFIDDFPGDTGGSSELPGDVAKPYYLTRLEEINVLGTPILNINCGHVLRYNQELYSQVVRYPQEVIPMMDQVTNELFSTLYPTKLLVHQIHVHTFNVEKTKNMRLLNPADIDQLITISGMVTRTSQIIPEMREAYFRCYLCHDTKTVEIDRGRIAEPAVCTHCQTLHSMVLIHNLALFNDKQVIKLQESPDDVPPGEISNIVMLFVHSDLVYSVQPGDRVIVTGIYRAVSKRMNHWQRTVQAVFKTFIDVIHFKKDDSDKLRGREEEDEEEDEGEGEVLHKTFSAERREQLRHLSRLPDIYERLSRALAPSIYGHDDIKKGILLQLLGGTRKDFQDSGRTSFRADLNILLCGDPGTSKSQLLKYVHELVPRGQYTSGKGSSAVGLTAYVMRDPEIGQPVLQPGALALSDKGVCCIDEFDKMTDNTRAILHEVMEQQTMSIAKAGIICTLNARTSILAAANPRMSKWDEKMTVVENIQLPHTLLSRFDLIFLMLDPQDEQFDQQLGFHLVSLYKQSQQEKDDAFMDMADLRDYIAFARSYIHPDLSEEAGQALIQAYVDMRKIGSGRGVVTAYPRQLESLIRLSEAHAKMRFSQSVEIVDVEEAKRLHREALKQSATDPKTGIIDVGILTTGISSSERIRRKTIAKEIKKMIQGRGKAVQLKQDTVFEELREQSEVGVSKQQFEAALKLLADENFLVATGQTIRLC